MSNSCYIQVLIYIYSWIFFHRLTMFIGKISLNSSLSRYTHVQFEFRWVISFWACNTRRLYFLQKSLLQSGWTYHLNLSPWHRICDWSLEIFAQACKNVNIDSLRSTLPAQVHEAGVSDKYDLLRSTRSFKFFRFFEFFRRSIFSNLKRLEFLV